MSGGRWRYYLRSPLGVRWFPFYYGWKTEGSSHVDVMLHVLASMRLPSVHGSCTWVVCWVDGVFFFFHQVEFFMFGSMLGVGLHGDLALKRRLIILLLWRIV